MSGLVSAVLLSLAIPPCSLGFLAVLAWAPLVAAAERAKNRRAALVEGALFGAVYAAWLFGWTARLGWHVFAGASLAGAVYGAAFAEACRRARALPAWARPAVPAAAWVLPLLVADNPVRPFFGSIVLLAGLHAPVPGPWLQLARPFGETGLLFFVLLGNGLLARLLVDRKRGLPYAAGAAALVAAAGLWGAARLRALDAAPRPPGDFTIACAQHDLPFPWEWRAAHAEELYRVYESMALEASSKGADLILFPQYQLPEDVYRESGRWGELARRTKAYVALGTDSPVTPMAYGKQAWVMGLVFAPDGSLYDTQVALHPSPVGRPMTIAGTESRPIPIPGLGKVALLPCFDDVSSRPARLAGKAGADVLLSIANDGLFKGTNHPALHMLRSRLRAVETARYVVRCIPNEGSAVIDPGGRVKDVLPQGKGLLISTW